MNLVQHLVVGADWSATFLLKSGTPSIPVPILGWKIDGRAWQAHYEWTYLLLSTETAIVGIDTILPRLTIQPYVIQEKDIKNDRTLTVGQEVQILVIRLEEEDTLHLGEGMIDFELRRIDPQPTRPILKFRMNNKQGYIKASSPAVNPLVR